MTAAPTARSFQGAAGPAPGSTHGATSSQTPSGTLTSRTARGASPTGTGAGSVIVDVEAPRETSVTATGSGSSTLTWQGEHTVELVATGGGTVDVHGGLPGTNLEGVIVTVGLDSGPTAGVVIDSAEAGVVLDPEETVEVTIS